jgi:hypothetical protein
VAVSMSKQEFGRLEVLLRVQSGRLRVSDACMLIGLQRRQVFRLLRGLKQDGATSLLSKRRGRPSNHRLPAEVRRSVPRPEIAESLSRANEFTAKLIGAWISGGSPNCSGARTPRSWGALYERHGRHAQIPSDRSDRAQQPERYL